MQYLTEIKLKLYFLVIFNKQEITVKKYLNTKIDPVTLYKHGTTTMFGISGQISYRFIIF